jgi:Txe/YoeB family toxin of toxin-antitoxin system
MPESRSSATSAEPNVAMRLLWTWMNHPFKGLGKPEPLKYSLKGWWSRRITREHRLVYCGSGKGAAQQLEIAACRYYY